MAIKTTDKKNHAGLVIALSVMLVVSGCSVFKSKKNTGSAGGTAPPQTTATYLDFGDVLLPKQMKMDREDSFVFTTSGFTAGMLSLSGRVEVNSLFTFFENKMPEDGWQMVSAMKAAQSMLLFKKQTRWCVINITEGSLNTIVKIWVSPTIGTEGTGLLK